MNKRILSKLDYVEIPSYIDISTLDVLRSSELYTKALFMKMKWLLGESYLSNQINFLLECSEPEEVEVLKYKFDNEGIQFIVEDRSPIWDMIFESDNDGYKCSIKFDKSLVLYVNNQEIARIN